MDRVRIKRKSGFTLLELLVTAGATVIIASLATANAVVTARLFQIQRRSNDVTGQIQRVADEISKDFEESVISGKSFGNTNANVHILTNGQITADGTKPPSSIIYLIRPSQSVAGLNSSINYIRTYCLIDNAGSLRLVRYQKQFDDHKFIGSAVSGVPYNCSAANLALQTKNDLQLTFATTPDETQYLTDPSIKINYLRILPVWAADKAIGENYDLDPPAISIEISAEYDPNNDPSNTDEIRDDIKQYESKPIIYHTIASRCKLFSTSPSKCRIN